VPGEKPSEQKNPRSIGGRRVFSPLRHPCSPLILLKETKSHSLQYRYLLKAIWSSAKDFFYSFVTKKKKNLTTRLQIRLIYLRNNWTCPRG